MTRHTNQDFIRGSVRDQVRTLATVGVVAIVVIACVIVGTAVFYPRATAPKGVHVQLTVPALGPGVKAGSTVLLRGAEVGEVTNLSSPSAGVVHIDLVIQDAAAEFITDTVEVDFRPENYFGITAVNLIKRPGGTAVTDGANLQRDYAPDFTMSTMLEQGSLVVDGTLTREMIQGLDEVIRYADGLAPLVRSGIIVADTVAQTQQQLPSTLLRRANDLMVEFPAFNREVVNALWEITNNPYNRLPDGSRGVDDAFHRETDEALALASSDLFGKAGDLLASHDTQLTPLTTLIELMAAPLPRAIGGGVTVAKTAALIEAIDSAFAVDGDQRTLRVRVVLDSLPGMAGTLSQLGVNDRTLNGGS